MFTIKPITWLVPMLLAVAAACAQTATAQPAPDADAPPTATSGEPATGPADQPPVSTNGMTTNGPATRPVDGTALYARVIEVTGKVEHAAGAPDPMDPDAWQPVKPDMELGSDTQIRTGLRSRCTLQFGRRPDETIVQVRSATLASIRDFQRTDDAQKVRIGLGYGTVRGGSSEGTLRSDVVVDSTVATLAKRGTEGWQMEIEPVTGAFIISLSKSGLVEAYSKADRRSRGLLPGEYANNDNIARMWINQQLFDQTVRFFEMDMFTASEIDFLTWETAGYTNLGPDGGQLLRDAGRAFRQPVPTGVNPLAAGAGIVALDTILFQRGPTSRPEGNFGFQDTFRVLAPRGPAAKALRRALRIARR